MSILSQPAERGSLNESGMICYVEPDQIEEVGPGFLLADPAALITRRELSEDEDIRLRIQQDLAGTPTEIGVASQITSYAFGDLFVTEFWFDLSGGSITVPLGLAIPTEIIGHLGVFNTTTNTWSDMISVRIQGPVF